MSSKGSVVFFFLFCSGIAVWLCELLWGSRASISCLVLSFSVMSEHIGHLCFSYITKCFAELQEGEFGFWGKPHETINHYRDLLWIISRKQLYLLWYQYIFLYTHSNKNAVLVAQWIVYKYDFFHCSGILQVFSLDCLSKFGLSWKNAYLCILLTN